MERLAMQRRGARIARLIAIDREGLVRRNREQEENENQCTRQQSAGGECWTQTSSETELALLLYATTIRSVVDVGGRDGGKQQQGEQARKGDPASPQNLVLLTHNWAVRVREQFPIVKRSVFQVVSS